MKKKIKELEKIVPILNIEQRIQKWNVLKLKRKK
jgi:hypothetical protein